MEDIEQEIFNIGITNPSLLFSTERFAGKLKEYFDKIGKLSELKEYFDKRSKCPDCILMEEVADKWNGSDAKAPFYEILEQEGITLDYGNFLRLDGERVAYVGEQIIPLKGKKERLREALEEIIELSHELNYPNEVYELPSYADQINGWFNSEENRWIHVEDIIQANKSAYDFGLFWQNVDKPIKESENPFVQALIHLDKLPEYNPEEELRQVQLQKEFNEDQIKLKLLEELERVKAYKGKKWGIIPTNKLVMNPGYEEFFYNHLGDYSTSEIDDALRDLEKELMGNDRKNVKTLRKEFEKKEGMSRKKKWALILGGLLAGAAGCYAARELIGGEKPATDSRWKPTRVVNGKVYDASVSFVADVSFFGLNFPIVKEASLQFIPINYTHLPQAAFPKESVRNYKLTPLDGVFDESKEEFAVNITDIKGGREYEIKILIKDSLGIERVEKIKTPYIREFENIAPLDDKLIGAYYYPWYSSDRHWKEGYKGTPLLGEYDSRDSIVISKHIDWATGHGIDFFLMSWWGPNSWEDITIKDYFLKNPLINDIKFGILYESTGRLSVTKIGKEISINLNNPANRQTLLSDFNYLANTYFSNPSFLKVNNAHVVELHLARIFKGDVSEVISNLRKEVHNMGHNIYLIGDLVYWHTPSEMECIKSYDAITPYNMHTSVPWILDNFENKVAAKYKEWFNAAKDLKVGFIPSALPGFDDKAIRTGNIPLSKSTKRFEKQMKIAKSYIDNNLKMIMITTFNEWHEYTYVEPSNEDGYKYLQIIIEYCR